MRLEGRAGGPVGPPPSPTLLPTTGEKPAPEVVGAAPGRAAGAVAPGVAAPGAIEGSGAPGVGTAPEAKTAPGETGVPGAGAGPEAAPALAVVTARAASRVAIDRAAVAPLVLIAPSLLARTRDRRIPV
ncbi:MAG: hypothetical protein A2Y80_10605 [Deltaproteobacteria bacterium RBG_13_58_19]|nr:MAG: hypothetical protein A2Y80_10605 [Deltaproteobacteria bacterium RBG_13_58_19]